MKNLKSMSPLKKIPFIVLIIAVIAFFAIPSFIFADEGDATTWVGIDPDQEQQGIPGTTAGQYLIGDDNDNLSDSENDGDTEVFCIDGEKYLITGDNQYVPSDIDISDEIVGEADLEGAPHIVTPAEAVAAEILSTTATGATAVEDQVAMWQFTGDNPGAFSAMADPRTNEASQEGQVQAIIANVEALAQEYVAATGYSDTNPDPSLTIDQFLANEKINSLEVTVKQDSTIFTGSKGTATATMADPLVPEITDSNKDVYWYILAGSFNISFSKTSLVFKTDSNAAVAGTNPAKMNDVDGSSNDLTDPTAAGYVASKSDNYGEAKVDYYYFWWGLADYPQDTMGINLYAWADIDKDAKFDFIDLSSENPGGDTDGSAVVNFKSQYNVVQNISGTTVITAPIDMPMDIHEIEGGKVVFPINNLPEDNSGNPIVPTAAALGERDNSNQRFATQSYTEGYNIDPKFFGTLIFKYAEVNEVNFGLPNAEFGIYDGAGATGKLLMTIITDGKGYASTGNAGLEYGTYYVMETKAPSGYDLNKTVYTLIVGGNGVGISSQNKISDSAPFGVINTPTPPPVVPPTTPPTVTTKGGTVTVAALTTGGIQVLAFTGQDPIISIAGLAAIMAGLAMVIVTLTRKYNLKLQNAKK